MRPQHAGNQFPLPLPEDVTERHIGVLLQLIHCLNPFLLTPYRDTESLIKSNPELDGGAAAAATTTFIKACGHLDAIMDDPGRFRLDRIDNLYKEAQRVWKSQADVQEAQAKHAAELVRPCIVQRAKLIRLNDGVFVAYWGDITEPGQGLLGKGLTPDEAFKDFDAAWLRNAAEQVKLRDTPKPAKKTPRKKR